MKIQKSGTRILAMLLSFSIIFSGMPAQAGYLDNQTVFASSDSTQQEEFFSGSENGISVDDLTKVIESDRTEITQVLIKEEDSVKDIEVSEENEISNDTEVSEENEISNDTEISGDNGISNDTEVSEDNEITEDAEVSENSEVSEEEQIVYENFGDWSFEILNESDAVLTAYNGEDTDIIIPNTVEANGTQYDVVELAEEIFKYNNEITSVTFGSKLIAIGEGAFENCENLTTVDMSPAVELISTGSAAFRGCISLVSITYSDSQEIVSENAFAGCSSLVSNEFGPSITTIGAGAFEYCTSLKNVNLTDTIIIIERYAFSHCSAIERVDFPDSITSIGLEAFSYCDNLSEVAYPINYKISLCEFGEDYAWLLDGYRGHIFLGCSKLHKIVIPEGTKRIAPYVFADCTSINEIILPESLEGIDRSAFENCTGIKTIELPESLERIEAFTFYGCTGMETIELKSNLKSIGGHAFEKSGLTDLTLPANIITIEEGAFQDADFLKTIAFSEGLNRIESYAFMGCSSLEKLELPDSVTEIGYKAFANCESVSAANLPKNYSNSICKEYNDNSLDAVGDNGNLFYGCKNLKTVTIPEGMELLPPYVFANCSYLETISFPKSMKTISRYAFYNCSGLTEVNFTDGLTVIGPHAFEKATAVKELILPKNLETIGDTALCGMSSLESISFNSSLKVIQSYALKGNISLKEIKIPKNVTDIGYQAFADCINLRSFGYPEGYVRSLCKDSNDEFWTFEDSMGNIISGCTKLNVLEIPEGVEYIPRFAFANCQNLKYVTIPDSVITIGKFAFYNCDALSEIIMGKQTAIISENAFKKCSGIEAASFSISTSYIGDAAFNGCDKLGEVYYEGTQTQWNEIAIGEENSSFGNANFHFEADGSEYTSVLSQPRLTAEANGHKQMKLSWTYEGDQAAVRSYVLYRSEDGVNFKIVGAMDADANEYLDSVSFTGKSKTYYYKISVYDKYDRSETSEVISCKAVANDTSKPNAVISLAGLNYAQAGDAFYVSGGLSNDNDSIASYDWDFGDGTMETGTDTSHIYQTPGEYTVSLTVTDINGNKEKTTTSVNVVEIGNESDYTKISLSVCDATSLGAVPNAQVMIKQGENSRLISSDKTGNVQFVVPNGDYIVSVTAEGYTLRTMKINATGKAFSQTIGLLKGSIMSSEFTVTELTYDEIVAAGIDVTAEGNQHVYKFAATFTFVAGLKEYDFPYFVLKNENGETVGISGSGSITFKDIDDYDISINIKPLSEKFVLVIYGEAHWLKEMYKVKELAPGGYIELNLSTTIWFNSLLELVELTKLGSFVDIAYYLTDVSVVTMEGSTTEIPYTIEVERAERDSLLDKVVEGFVGKALEKAGVELPSGSLGGTLIYLAEKQLGFTIPLGGVLELQQGSTNHVLTITADDGRGVGDSIYNDVVRVNTGDGSNQLVDVLNGTKYEVSPLGLSIEAKGLGGTSFKIGMEDSLGNLQKEYTLNLTTTNDIYNDTLVVEADKETHTVQVNEEQFTASVKKLNDETLEHYKENPFVTVKSGLEIEVSEQTQTTSSHVIMKSAQLDQIEDSVITDVVIHTQNGSLDFDRETLNQLNEAKEDITVSLEKYVESESGDAYGFDDKPTYIFTARNSKGKIVKFVNNVGVSIPYELQNPNANILIKHGLDDGDVEYLTAVYDPKEKNIYFETGSFSSFTIIETNSEIAEDGSVYYTISFNGNGGAVRLASASDIASGNNISGNVVSSNDVSENLISGNKVYTLKVSYNGIFGKMPIAEKEGYTFAGWFTDPVSGNQIKTGDKLLADGDMILYAHFTTKSASDNSASDNNVSDNNVSDNSTSDNNVSDNNVSDNNVSDNNAAGNTIKLTLDFGDAALSVPIKTVTIGEKYGDALPTAKDIVTPHGELFCGWYNEKGELITADSIAKKEDGKLTARFEKRTIVVKQQMEIGDFFTADLAAYEKYIAELGAADGKDYSKKLKFKYVVHTESAQDAKLIPNTKKSDNKLATVSLKKNAVTGEKTGILTAKKSGVAKVSLLTQRLVNGKWTYVEGDTYLYVAIEKPVPKAKKFTLTYIGQELAIDHVLGYEYSDKLGYDPNIAEVKYQPSKDGIIKVDPVTGRVEAVKTGSVKLIITYTTELPTGKTSTVKVSIPIYVKIPGFKVKPEGVTMKAGKSKKTTLRNTLKEETVTYTSGDTEIAAVDEKGKVTGVKAGTTEITATVLSADGHKDTYSYKVTVTE